jgi:hypothetical protein
MAMRTISSLRMLAATPAGVGLLEIVIGVLFLFHLLNCLDTGRTTMRYGTPIYRDQKPGMYWANIVFEIVFISLFFYSGWRDLHR